MKKSMLLAFIFVCITATIFAQSQGAKSASRFMLGVLGGLNIPRLSDGSSNEMTSDYTSRLGEAFGVTASYSFMPNLSIRADALYSSEGGRRKGMQAIDATAFNPMVPAGSYFYADFKNESILNYFEVPLMLKFSVPAGKPLKCYADFGPMIGLLLNAKQETSGESVVFADKEGTIPIVPEKQSFESSVTTTKSIKPVNFGLTGGFGASYGGSFGEVFLDIRGAYGLTYVQKNASDGKSHNGNLLIALGYCIHI